MNTFESANTCRMIASEPDHELQPMEIKKKKAIHSREAHKAKAIHSREAHKADREVNLGGQDIFRSLPNGTHQLADCQTLDRGLGLCSKLETAKMLLSNGPGGTW